MMKKNRNYKFIIRNLQNGMTLIELIVVLGIFAVMSTVVLFNYGSFESKVDITNLANDIALQVVTAQKASLSGLLPTQSYGANWKPSYGVYFSSGSTPSAGDSSGTDYKDFIYFVDLNQDNQFDLSSCPSITGECLSKFTITKNDYISDIRIFPTNETESNLTITFSRPSSQAVLYSNGKQLYNVSYVQITVLDQTKKIPAYIDLYPSGRVQIN